MFVFVSWFQRRLFTPPSPSPPKTVYRQTSELWAQNQQSADATSKVWFCCYIKKLCSAFTGRDVNRVSVCSGQMSTEKQVSWSSCLTSPRPAAPLTQTPLDPAGDGNTARSWVTSGDIFKDPTGLMVLRQLDKQRQAWHTHFSGRSDGIWGSGRLKGSKRFLCMRSEVCGSWRAPCGSGNKQRNLCLQWEHNRKTCFQIYWISPKVSHWSIWTWGFEDIKTELMSFNLVLHCETVTVFIHH